MSKWYSDDPFDIPFPDKPRAFTICDDTLSNMAPHECTVAEAIDSMEYWDSNRSDEFLESTMPDLPLALHHSDAMQDYFPESRAEQLMPTDSSLVFQEAKRPEDMFALVSSKGKSPMQAQPSAISILQRAPQDIKVLDIVTPGPMVTPSIRNGLGNNRANRDLVKLGHFILSQMNVQYYSGALYLYLGTHWEKVNDHRGKVEIRALCENCNLASSLTDKEYSRILAQIKGAPDIQREQPFPAPIGVINFRNGTLFLDTMELQPHHPDDDLCYVLDAEYNPSYRGSGRVFERFVEIASNGNVDVRQQILELILIVLARLPVKAYFMLVGSSGSGKSQLARFIIHILGQGLVGSIPDIHALGSRFGLSNIEGKHLLTCLDLPASTLPARAISTLKMLVGDDVISCEQKYQDMKDIYIKPIFLAASNHPLRLPNLDQEDALLQRLVTIPLVGVPSEAERVPQLYLNLVEETNYIIHQAISYYPNLVANGYRPLRIAIPEIYAPEDSRIGRSSVSTFIQDCCTLSESANVSTEALYVAFEEYCENLGEPVCNSTSFSRMFREEIMREVYKVTPQKRVGDGKRGYSGIQLS